MDGQQQPVFGLDFRFIGYDRVIGAGSFHVNGEGVLMAVFGLVRFIG